MQIEDEQNTVSTSNTSEGDFLEDNSARFS